MNDDLDIDLKEIGGYEPQVPREEWAKKYLYWDDDRKMWEIPGTGYSLWRKGTVEHANHLYLYRTFPWLEQDGTEADYRLFLEPDKLDWMPLWIPFTGYVKKAISGTVIDENTMEEIAEEAIEYTWKEKYAKEFSDALIARFADQLRAARPAQEIEAFVHGPNGLRFFNRMASEAEEFWDASSYREPSINVDRVADVVTWEKLRSVMYPERNQLRLPNLGVEEPEDRQLGLALEALGGGEDDEEDEISSMMRDIKISDLDSIKAWLDEELDFDEYPKMWTLASYSDYSGSLVDRANAKHWLTKYPGVVSKVHGGMGTEWIGIKEDRLEELAPVFSQIKEEWEGLQNYPLIDEEIHSELQIEAQQEAWNDWVKREVKDELVKAYPDLEDAIEEFMDKDEALAMFEDARDKAGEEWNEETGGDMYVRVGEIVNEITEQRLRNWMFPPYNDPNQQVLALEHRLEEAREFSCVMAPAPPDLAAAIINWGQMYVLDDEIFYGDEPGFGREDEPHVTVKYGLHDATPSPALLKIIEETQPFEIAIGMASLFEAEKYDVLKFDVDSEALRALNARISAELPVTDTHPEYHPHLTVAYVQKGTARELIGKPLLDASAPASLRFLVKAVLFSGKSDNAQKTRLFLGKPNTLDDGK